MKAIPCLLFATALITGGCQSMNTASTPVTFDNVTVAFNEPDNFTDAREHFGSGSSEYYLDVLSKHIQKVAAKRLAPGQKLAVTVNDVDLAGEILPIRQSVQEIRIVKEIYIPRLSLTFKLTDENGVVIKEGERRLLDMNFMNNLSIIDRNQPLFYDKPLIDNWVESEFKS